MEKKLLIINVGTSSKKYAFYIGGQKLMFSHYERENGGFIVTHQDEEGKETKINIFETDFQNSSAKEIEYLVFSGLIKNRTEINAAAAFRAEHTKHYHTKTAIFKPIAGNRKCIERN